MDHAVIQAAAVLTYLFAGKAKVTLVSKVTGKHFTYEIRGKADKNDPDKRVYFVHYLAGPDNQNDYMYLGTIFDSDSKRVQLTKKSRVRPEAPVYRALSYALQHPTSEHLQVLHSGACGRCGRELTDPTSVQTGIGPICRGKL